MPGNFLIQPFPDPRQIGADDTHAAGHRFHQNQGQPLKEGGQDKNIALIHCLGKLLLGQHPQKDRCTGYRLGGLPDPGIFLRIADASGQGQLPVFRRLQLPGSPQQAQDALLFTDFPGVQQTDAGVFPVVLPLTEGIEDAAVVSGPDDADLFGGDGKKLGNFLLLRLMQGKNPVELWNLLQDIRSLPGVLMQLPQIGAMGNRIDPVLGTELPHKGGQIIQVMTENHIGPKIFDGLTDLISECLPELSGHLRGHVPIAGAGIGHLIGHPQNRIRQGLGSVTNGIAGDALRQNRYILRTYTGNRGLLMPVPGEGPHQLGQVHAASGAVRPLCRDTQNTHRK